MYFVQCRASALIKIGFSWSVPQRIAHLHRYNAPGLVVLAVLPTPDPQTERRIQARFVESYERGEWFRPDAALLEFICEVRKHEEWHLDALRARALIGTTDVDLEHVPVSRTPWKAP